MKRFVPMIAIFILAGWGWSEDFGTACREDIAKGRNAITGGKFSEREADRICACTEQRFAESRQNMQAEVSRGKATQEEVDWSDMEKTYLKIRNGETEELNPIAQAGIQSVMGMCIMQSTMHIPETQNSPPTPVSKEERKKACEEEVKRQRALGMSGLTPNSPFPIQCED